MFPRIHPFTLDNGSLRGRSVLSTRASPICQIPCVEGRETLCPRHGLRDTSVRSTEDGMEDLEFLLVILQRISLHVLIGPRRFDLCRQFCWHHHGLRIVLSNEFSCTD